MKFEGIDGKSSTPNEDRKIQPLDPTKLKSQELKKQRGLLESKNDAVSQKLESISPSMRQTYEWVLQQRYPRLTGEKLEKAIWKLHEYRQKNDKTVVAPDKSNTQTLIGQASHWSSDTRVSSAESQDGERLKDKLRESFRSVVQEYRQEGKIPSGAPTFLEDMTDSQIRLEVMRNADWLEMLEKQGIKANKETFDSIRQMLDEIQMKSPMPSDYNPPVDNFNTTLNKFKGKDVNVQRVEPVGLGGGSHIEYDQGSKKYRGRIMTLEDPHGNRYEFKRGEENATIAHITTQTIEWYRLQYSNELAESYIDDYGHDPGQIQREQYKDLYSRGKALTANDVMALRSGHFKKGWKCTEFKRVDLEKSVYYTDKRNKIYALDLSPYEPYTIEQHKASDVPHPPIGHPTPRFNCFSEFINRKGWVIDSTGGSQIQMILDDNGYFKVKEEEIDAKELTRREKNGEEMPIAIYRKNGKIAHLAKITGIGPNGLKVETKPGDWALVPHDLHDEWATREYGEPTVYDTKRGSHMLHETPP